ncbi:hypothetical protein QBC37DRAFT_85839 [Rhypophila decipiens]|uniref:Uncharacterized protein n=1 Tax=Rhypophila decipiens TaxID=261697 RepID=A0AAN6XWI3_9PEZI|nr:hypothetical protein QBC37DRAFT_85839 [Rhypophila decipiens]
MTLTTATQLTTRAQGARRASLSAIGSSRAFAAAPAVCHSQHQVRAFRFGRLWTSYFDPEFSQNDCRRQRQFRYKYAEALSRRLSWDPNSVASGDAKPAHKRELRGYWDAAIGDTEDGAKAPKMRFAQKTPDNPEGIRPGQNIEDAERAPLEDLLFGHHQEQYPKAKAAHPKKHRRGQPRTKGTLSVETDYVIDPITNRKVPKPSGPEHAVSSFKSYRSQFAQFMAPECTSTQPPIFYDGPPPEAELKKYSKVKIDSTPWDPVSIGLQSDVSKPDSELLNAITWKHQEVFWHHEDGVTSPKVWALGPDASEYTDLHKYRPVPDEKSRPSDQQPCEQYGDLSSYVAVRSHEPDGKYKAQADAETREYQDLEEYEAGTSHQPSQVLSSHTNAEGDIQRYEDLHKYGPTKAYEPDGKYKVQQESSVPQYEDLGEYGPVRAHEPDGKYKAKADTSAASEIDPEELSMYGAFRSHEPDGLYAANYVKPTPDPEELAQYTSFRSHEPDGKYAASHQNSTEDRVEVTRYQAFRSHEPDGKYAVSSQVDPTEDYRDLETYGPFLSHEPDGKYATEQSQSAKQSQELGQYQAFRSHEPDGKYAAQSESCTEVPDLGYHEAFGYEDSETMTPPPGHGTGADLKEYKTVHFNELDGPTASHLKEQNHDTPSTVEEMAGGTEGLETSKSEYRQLQELLMAETAAEESAAGNAKVDGVNEEPDSFKSLTGNYVRDFPEEFTQSWSLANSGQDSALLPNCWRPPFQSQVEIPKSKAHDSLPKSPNALESALDRHQKLGNGQKSGLLDQYSKEPQGLETSYAKECGKDVPVYATIYNSTNPEPQSSASTSPPATESSGLDTATPMLYKVLVYNAESQSVEIAETTSIVPDTATPLTPAEVLLRISHPSKFLPHFAPLQAQGFEIVSGNGDVLIFRKLREAWVTPDTSDNASARQENGEPTALSSNPPLINPIDMTGGGLREIDAYRFTSLSPTGFVNYNLPPPYCGSNPSYASAESIEPGSETSRETPTSNRSKSASEQSDDKIHKSLPKRLLVSALWLGGLSYSVAVVGNYFKTGGVDGKGTRGRL